MWGTERGRFVWFVVKECERRRLFKRELLGKGVY